MDLDFHSTLIRYFTAEKYESVMFFLVGCAALGFGVLLLLHGGAYRMAAIPLIAVALAQIPVGAGVFLRTDAQVTTLTARWQNDRSAFRAEETDRMTKVMNNFRVYKYAEIAILALGVALALFFPHREKLYAAGIGCIAQGAFMLIADLFAEHRGQQYLDAVGKLSQ